MRELFFSLGFKKFQSFFPLLGFEIFYFFLKSLVLGWVLMPGAVFLDFRDGGKVFGGQGLLLLVDEELKFLLVCSLIFP